MQSPLLLVPVLLPLLGGLPVFKLNKRTTRRNYLTVLLVLELVLLAVMDWQGETFPVLTLTDSVRIVLGADGGTSVCAAGGRSVADRFRVCG